MRATTHKYDYILWSLNFGIFLDAVVCFFNRKGNMLNKNNIKSPFVSVVLLIILLYGSTFAVESFLISRMGFDAPSLKFWIVSAILGFSIYLSNYLKSPLLQHINHCPSIKNLCVLAILLVFILLLKMGFVYQLMMKNPIDLSLACQVREVNIFSIIRSCLLSPATETILFVYLLPVLFIRRYPALRPWMVFCIVAIIFSLVHIPTSSELFISRFLLGVLFCFIFFGMRSLLGAFLLHAVINTSLLILDQFGEVLCKSIPSIDYVFLAAISIVGLTAIFAILISLNKKISTAPFLVG